MFRIEDGAAGSLLVTKGGFRVSRMRNGDCGWKGTDLQDAEEGPHEAGKTNGRC